MICVSVLPLLRQAAGVLLLQPQAGQRVAFDGCLSRVRCPGGRRSDQQHLLHPGAVMSSVRLVSRGLSAHILHELGVELANFNPGLPACAASS